MTLIKMINDIIEFGSKTTTYKYAVLLAIFDYITEHCNETPKNNFHTIPIVYLARKFVVYYYPLYINQFHQMKGNETAKLRVFQDIDAFIKNIPINDEEIRIIPFKNALDIFDLESYIDTSLNLADEMIKLLWNVRRRILDQPLQFLRKVRKATVTFFSIISKDQSFTADYNSHLQSAIDQKEPERNSGVKSWIDVLKYDNSILILDNSTFRELAKYRFWAQKVILKAWFEDSMNMETDTQSNPVKLELLIKSIGFIYSETPERDYIIMRKYRKTYEQIGINRCLYSNKKIISLADYDLDHFFPWKYYHVNRFWNLYPALNSINRKKSALLPEFTEEIEARIHDHLLKCIQNPNELIKNDLQYYFQILQKEEESEKKKDPLEIVKGLIEFMKGEYEDLLESIPGDTFRFDNSTSKELNLPESTEE